MSRELIVTVEVDKTYAFHTDLKRVSGFKFVSEWEGYAKFEHPDTKEVIIVSNYTESPFTDFFSKIFGNAIKMTIVKASPDIVHKLSLTKE